MRIPFFVEGYVIEMKKVWKFLSYVLVAVLASVATLATLTFVGGNGQESGLNGSQSKLDQLEELIQNRFVGEADKTAMEDAAAKAMIAALGDRWSYYISAEDYQSYVDDVNNSYVGIGMTIQKTGEEPGFRIIKVTAGSPAEEAGLLVNDRVVAVDGNDVRELNADELSTFVKGEEGTSVRITVVREDVEKIFTVERRTVHVPAATGQMLENNIGLVTIENFHSGCAEQTIEVIENLRSQGATALILDVRYNGGGYAQEMVDLLDYLLPEGVLFRTVNYAGKEEVSYSDADYLDMPMAVLVNGSSYSAAEFFAVALREYDAALVVGEQTVGKGYYQVNYRLNDGSAVNLSIGEYFTPNGENLAGIGITPDILITVDEETAAGIYAGTLDPREDPQIQAAVEALLQD